MSSFSVTRHQNISDRDSVEYRCIALNICQCFVALECMMNRTARIGVESFAEIGTVDLVALVLSMDATSLARRWG